ncbi:uncharacterized protein RHOBADRAFT_41829 [Rhodotorula graminis WP1]|uniref:Uncharacterized protein n=1 Tax=Rhodotorula graminis (strain WP1) TaxID=578459 RepID=A0A194SB50_RHOGW|nr:uncharacterized protein RHOBADRAFT_41829 [Rhodotorula graminis WP1]KPV77832.1 hypothetical protein RHOBADRAFT_41829 [Rhodotorula graminis WP1]
MPFRKRLREHGRAFERFVLCGPAEVDPAHHPQARRPTSKANSLDAARRLNDNDSRKSSTTTAGSQSESSGEGTVVPSEAPHLGPPGSPLSPLRASVLFRPASQHSQRGQTYPFLDTEYTPPSQRSQGLETTARTRDPRAEGHRWSTLSGRSYAPSAVSQGDAHVGSVRALDKPVFRGQAREVNVEKPRRHRDKALPPLPGDSPYGSIGTLLNGPRRR